MDSLFPYMHWAQTESFLSPFSLSQSGMPPPPTEVLGPLERYLEPPNADALTGVRGRIAELFDVAPERVLVTLGASGAMHLIALALFRPPARVVTELPSYEPFRQLPPFFGAELRVVERTLERRWALEPEAFAAAIASPASDPTGFTHVFVCNPHNPTGVATDADSMRRLAALAEPGGGTLIGSETYMEFAPPEQRLHAFQLAPNTLSIGSLTKAYGLGPIRVGWIIAGEDRVPLIEQMHDLAFLTYVDPPTPSLHAARAALDKLPQLLQPARQFEHDCKPLLTRWLEDSPHVEGLTPDFGLTAFPRIVDVNDTRSLSRYLQTEHGVDTVPGEFFGLGGHLRVGFGVPQATLEEGLARLDRGIAAFRARRDPAR